MVGAGGREATSSAACANSAGQKVCCERADQTFGRFAAVALLLSIGGARGAFCLAERGEGSDGGESVMLLTKSVDNTRTVTHKSTERKQVNAPLEVFATTFWPAL